jgi:hypothetical protein
MRHIVVLLLLLFASPSIQNQSAQNSHTEANVKQPQSTDGASSPSVHQPETKPERNDAYDPRKDSLYRAYLAATIFGVVAALGGIYAIYKQTEATKQAAEATAQSAKETARSAKATEDSVNLQKIALRQWVNVRKWQTAIPDPDKRPEMMQIEFEVINPTRAPISLIYVDITAASGESGARGFPQNMMLIPDNPLKHDAVIKLTPEQLKSYYHGTGLNLAIEGSIVYMDTTQEEWEQRFRVLLNCHLTYTYMAEYFHTLHKVTKLSDPNEQ